MSTAYGGSVYLELYVQVLDIKLAIKKKKLAITLYVFNLKCVSLYLRPFDSAGESEGRDGERDRGGANGVREGRRRRGRQPESLLGVQEQARSG